MKLRKWRKLQTNSHSSNRHSSHHGDGEKAQLMASKVRPMMTKKTLDREVHPMMTKKNLGREARSMMTKKTMNPYVEYRPVPIWLNLEQNSSQAQLLGQPLKIHSQTIRVIISE